MSVVVNLQTNRIYELNRTASALWELLEAGCDRTQVEEAMLDQFDVGNEELSREIDEAILLLSSVGLVADDVSD
jgi:coenzyme PQQ synthesis protein D (PqqD)